jgi:DNA polymerase III subunit epsilon
MRNLKIERPLVFFDLETTGLEITTARVVEISLLKILPDGKEVSLTHLINPEIPIPEESTLIHGIKDSDVADKPTFKELAVALNEFILDSDLSGFNIKRFDLPLLEVEFRRSGTTFSRRNRYIIDSQFIFHKMEPRDLRAAYQRYCGKGLEECHAAEKDARAAAEVLDSQIEVHAELPKDIAGLHNFCCQPGEDNWLDSTGRLIQVDGEVVLNFGKHKGKNLKAVIGSDPDYLKWLIHQANFPLDVQEIVIRFMSGDYILPD